MRVGEKLTDANRMSDQVRVEHVQGPGSERKSEPDALELFSQHGARLAVDMRDGHARGSGAERDEVFLDG